MLLDANLLQTLLAPGADSGGMLTKGLQAVQSMAKTEGADQVEGGPNGKFQAELLSNMLDSQLMQGADIFGAGAAASPADLAASFENNIFQNSMLLDVMVALSNVSESQNHGAQGFNTQGGLGQTVAPSTFNRAMKAFAAAARLGDPSQALPSFPTAPQQAPGAAQALPEFPEPPAQLAESDNEFPSVIRRAVTPPEQTGKAAPAPPSSAPETIRPESDSRPPSPNPAPTALARSEAAPSVSGELSAAFESGKRGVAEIGYDRMGGTSYGSYQISSKLGVMDNFLEFLDQKAPEWASRLRLAGPADTGSTQGAMPEAWRGIASEAPEAFEKLQHDFIARTHYATALDKIRSATGLDVSSLPGAIQEVLFSTAVQHGSTGAARIFERALDSLPGGKIINTALRSVIDSVYDERKGQFGGSTSIVRRSVQNRLEREKQLALSMFDAETTKS